MLHEEVMGPIEQFGGRCQLVARNRHADLHHQRTGVVFETVECRGDARCGVGGHPGLTEQIDVEVGVGDDRRGAHHLTGPRLELPGCPFHAWRSVAHRRHASQAQPEEVPADRVPTRRLMAAHQHLAESGLRCDVVTQVEVRQRLDQLAELPILAMTVGDAELLRFYRRRDRLVEPLGRHQVEGSFDRGHVSEVVGNDLLRLAQTFDGQVELADQHTDTRFEDQRQRTRPRPRRRQLVGAFEPVEGGVEVEPLAVEHRDDHGVSGLDLGVGGRVEE